MNSTGNTLRGDVMLRRVHDVTPELYAFVCQKYSEESILQFGRFVVRSQMGPQQGDPLLFCLPLQPTLRSLKSHFKLGYLDNISLGGHVVTPVKRPTSFNGCPSARSALTPWPSRGRLNNALLARTFNALTIGPNARTI